jgi:NADH-quinone oxidoreductase subunit L
MEWPLIPLAILALFGGLLNLPEYLGNGILTSFLTQAGNHEESIPHTIELILQVVAAVAAVAGISTAWFRYGGKRRQHHLALEDAPARGLSAFLMEGWRVDALYDLMFVRPYTWLSSILWQKVDEGCIDDSLDRTAALISRFGHWIGAIGDGRVSLSLLGMAAGAALMIGWLTWVIL